MARSAFLGQARDAMLWTNKLSSRRNRQNVLSPHHKIGQKELSLDEYSGNQKQRSMKPLTRRQAHGGADEHA